MANKNFVFNINMFIKKYIKEITAMFEIHKLKQAHILQIR